MNYKKLSKQILLFILSVFSAVFASVLIVPAQNVTLFIVAFILLLFACLKPIDSNLPFNRRIIILISLLFDIILTLRYALQLYSFSFTTSRWASYFHLPNIIFCVILCALLFAFSYYAILKFVRCLLLFIYKFVRRLSPSSENKKRQTATPMQDRKITPLQLLFCLITAIGLITVCSKSSPLYPFNDWVDANCFFTVGKSMFRGAVPYRDLFEQKGPLLYFIHGLASLISPTGFFGVYLLEIVASFFFLLFTYKILRLYFDKRSILLLPVLAFVIYTADTFCHGDSAEELCLPILAYALYVAVKSAVDDTPISNKDYFLIGLTAGCIFFIKFTFLGFYLGFIIVPAYSYLKNKQFSLLIKKLLIIILGVLVSAIPWAIYLGINGAIMDFLEVYLYDNLFLYSSSAESINGIFSNLLLGTQSFANYNGVVLVLIILGGIIGALFEKPKVYFSVLFTFAFSFAFIYIGGRQHVYYSLILSVFAVFGIIALCKLFNLSKFHLPLKTLCVLTPLICFALAFIFTPNRYLMGKDKSDLPQFQFKEIICKDENPTLLNYNFLDGGFYTACDIVPNCKAFCWLNCPIPTLTDLQNEYVSNGLVDYVVTFDFNADTDLFSKYSCVLETKHFFEGTNHTYRLYKLNS